jgi:tetratricopeptide (TPR) repeat protein
MNTPLIRVACRDRFATALMTIAFGVLLSFTLGRAACATDPPDPAPSAIATVNGEPLPRALFDRAFLKLADETVRFGPGIPLYRMWSYRLQALSHAVDEQLVAIEARTHDISVSENAINGALDDMVTDFLAQLPDGDSELETKIAQTCAALGGPVQPSMTEAQFRPYLREWLTPLDGEEMRTALTVQRLKAEVVPLPSVSEEELRGEFATVALRTIAIRYRPADRLEQAESEAKKRAEDILLQLRAGADFAALAATASDDDRYSATGGLEAETLLSSLNPDRQKAVASLQVGDVSDLIRTDRGYEIVRLDERGFQLPPDYEKTKPQLRARLAAERQEQAWQTHVKAMHDEATITVTDPELLAYTCLHEGKAEEALALLETASQDADSLGPAGAASVFFQLAARYSLQNRWDDATRAYASSDHYVSQVLALFPDARVATLLGLGHTYENLCLQLRAQQQPEQAQTALTNAVHFYQEAGKNTGSPSHHDRLRLAYARLGRADLAEQEETWLERHRSDMEARRKAIEESREPAADAPGGSP